MPPLKSNVHLGLTVIVGNPKATQNIYWKHFGKQTLKRRRKTLTQVTETKKDWPMYRHEKSTDNWLKKRNPLLNEQKPQNYKLLLKIQRYLGGNKVNFMQTRKQNNWSPEKWLQHFQTVFRTSEPRDDLPVSNTDGADAIFDEYSQKSVGNERAFLAILKERLCDDFNQEWTTAINSSEGLCLYASFKSNLITENYLHFVRIKCFRDVLIKWRMGVLRISCPQITFAMPTKMPTKYDVVFVKLKLKVKCILFASVRYTRNFVRNTSTGTCNLNNWTFFYKFFLWCSVTRKPQVKTLYFCISCL